MKTVMKTVMKSLIPLLVVASAVAAVDVQKRMLNGKDCPKDEGKHFVVLRSRTAPYKEFCGGNLISQDWVLTAGHCNIGKFDVGLGFHATDTEQTREITKEDQKYIYKEGSVLHDIMLVKLPRKPSWKLDTIKLPTADQCKSFKFDAEYTLIGWSFTAVDQNNIKNQKKAVKLQCGKVKLDQNCKQDPVVLDAQGKRSKYRNKHVLCSYEPMPCNGCSKKKPCESCGGDSGGSLVKKSDRVLYGVTVAGPDKPSGFSLYMNVCAYIDWIRKTTGIKE